MNMLTEKYSQKAEIKKDELELRRIELEFAKEKYTAEAAERKAKLEMEMQEKREIPSLLKDRLYKKKEKENVYNIVSIFHCMFCCFIVSKPLGITWTGLFTSWMST